MADNWEDQAVPIQPDAGWESQAVPVKAPTTQPVTPRPPAPQGTGTVSALSPEEYQKVESQAERAGTPLERAQGQGGSIKTLPRRAQEAAAYGVGASLAAAAGLPAGILHYSALPAYALGLTKTGDAINKVADAITPSSAQTELAKQAPKTPEGKVIAAGTKFATDVITLGAGGKVVANTGKIPKWAIPSYFAVQTAGNSASMAHASGKDASQPIRTTVGATSEAALAYLAGMTIGRTVPGPEFSNPLATAGAQVAGAGGVGAALQTGQNLVAKGTYDPDRPLMANVWESAAMFGAASLANTLSQTSNQRATMLEHPQGPEAYMKDFKTAMDSADAAHEEGHLKNAPYQGMKRAYSRSQAVYNQLMKTAAGKEAQAKAAAAEEFPTVKQLFPEGKGPTPEQEVQDALQEQGPAETVPREGSEGGNIPKGREGVGQGQQGEETPREKEEAQKEVAKPPVKIVDQTSYKGVRQGSLMGPDDEMMVAKDAKGNDIGKLWVTKKPDGFEVRKVEVDPKSRRQGVAEQLYVEAHNRYGAYKGATDQTPDGKAMNTRLRETHPEIFETTPKASEDTMDIKAEFDKPFPDFDKKGDDYGYPENLKDAHDTAHLMAPEELDKSIEDLKAFEANQVDATAIPEATKGKLKEAINKGDMARYDRILEHTDMSTEDDARLGLAYFPGNPLTLEDAIKLRREMGNDYASDATDTELKRSIGAHVFAHVSGSVGSDPATTYAIVNDLKEYIKRGGDLNSLKSDLIAQARGRHLDPEQAEVMINKFSENLGKVGISITPQERVDLASLEKKGDAYMVPPDQIATDPERLQFRDTKEPDPGLVKKDGDYLGWVDESGKLVVVDGHHSLPGAIEDGKDIPVRMIEAKDSETARAIGAMKNIAEGDASGRDAQRLFEETGITPEEVKAAGIKVKTPKIEAKDEVPLPKEPLYRPLDEAERKDVLAQVKDALPEAKPAKYAPKVSQESTAKRREMVKAIEPDPMVRAKMYRISGILNGDVDPTDEQIKAAQKQVRRSIKGVPAPLQGIIDRDPERGAIRVVLPKGEGLGPVFEKLGRFFGKQGPQRQGPVQKGSAVVALARSLDAKGMLQLPYDPSTRVMPTIAKSMVTGDVPAPLKNGSGANRDIPDMDTRANQLAHGLRSPHKIIESMFSPGEGPNIDQEFVSNHYIVLQKALTDYVNGVHKRYQIPDHSARIGAVMDPYRTQIRDTEQWLVPLINTRKEMETMLDQAERPGTLAKRLEEFDEENSERIEEGRSALQNLYREAKLKIQDLAQTTPEVRVAMYMEPPKKRPAWLADIIKPNEVEAAKALLRFTSEARVAGSQLGIPMRQDEYITHLFAPQGASRFTRDMTGEQERVARDILAFHRRQPDSVNLMPSTHAAMAYYVPTISRKIATQPFLNKWYQGGKNVYLDQNDSTHYAPNFGKWLQQRITEIEHPPQETVWEKGFQAIKSAEITKDMAFNQRVTIKHLVGKVTGLVALHHAYLLPASKDFVLRLARKPENLPLVRSAYERITGKPFEVDKDAKLVQALTTNLISSRQIRNALMEDPLVAEYNQPILNAFFGRSVRGMVQPVLNVAQKTRNILGQPLTAVEAFENELNFLASVHQGQKARLTPEEDVRGAVLNLLDYSFRGGHDASAFLKSPMGRMTAFSQTPTKMLENYVDIIRKGFNGEPDIYGSAGGATLIRAIVAAGAVSWLGEQYGKKAGLKLWRMLLHVPVVNEDYASDALSYAYHTLMADASNDPKHRRSALLAHRRMQGNQQGAMNLSPAGDILEDLTRLTNNPKAFVKSFPAVKQIDSEVGKVPKGYEDTLHYLSNAPTPEAEKKWEHMREQKGKAMMRKDEKRSRQ
jgi:hypothetical protein